MTLKELIEKHPDCLNLDLAITNQNGDFEFIWGSYATTQEPDYTEDGEPALILLWD